MPKVKGRGRLLRTRTMKIDGNKYMHIKVYSKTGPRGGHTVGGHIKTSKRR